MIIKWKEKVQLEVVNTYDEDTDTADTSDETFDAGEEVYVDLEDDRGDTVNFQFADGSMVYGVPKSSYEVIKDD